jgi:DNA-binding beta-propeller fold protein YncE
MLRNDSNVIFLNATTGASLGISIPTDIYPGGVAVDPAADTLYLLDFNPDAVVNRYSSSTGSVGIPAYFSAFAEGVDPFTLAINPVAGKIYVTKFYGNSGYGGAPYYFEIIDSAAGAPIIIVTERFPFAMVVNSTANAPNGILYVTNLKAVTTYPVNNATALPGTVTFFDAINGTTLGSFPVGINPRGIAVAL